MRALVLVLAVLAGCRARAPEPTFDERATALSEFAPSLPIHAPNTVAAVRERSLIHDRSLKRSGDPTPAYDYPTDPRCLEAGDCYVDYLRWLERRARDELVPREARDRLARTSAGMTFADADTLELELEAAANAFTAHALGPRSPKTLWLIRTGHPSDAARARAVAALPGADVQFLDGVDPTALSRRLIGAAIWHGRLIKNVFNEDQLRELLGAPALPPDPIARRTIDAHLHLIDAGAANLGRLLDRNQLAAAVIAPLPEDERYRGLSEANRVVLRAAAADPRLIPLVMISPESPAPVAELEALVAEGARGVKLLSGHGDYFRAGPVKVLDPPNLRALFRFCEQRGLPILWHVNLHAYADGLYRVLRDFPRLVIVVPHLAGYLTFAPSVVRTLLERYPNLHLDLSFGTQLGFVRRALEDLSFKRAEWRRLIADHPDRFLFGVDLVVDENTSPAHARMIYRLYRHLVEDEHYDLAWFGDEGYDQPWDDSAWRPNLAGLALSPPLLQALYFDNAARVYHAR